MIKNIGKFKQWTGERFGGVKSTLQSEDFQLMEKSTDEKRKGYDKIGEAIDMVYAHLLKRKTSPEDHKRKAMPLEALGHCLQQYSCVFPPNSSLGYALTNLGSVETHLAQLQETLAKTIKHEYKQMLSKIDARYKEYEGLRRKLESRRLNYDSKLNRLNRAKKEKPELEQEMQAAKLKYEETSTDLGNKMEEIEALEKDHELALLGLIQAQHKYHMQASELLYNVQEIWNLKPDDELDMFRSKSRESSQLDSHSAKVEVPTSHASDPSSHNGSISSHSSELRHSIDAPSKLDEGKSFRKTLFPFDGQNEDELSFEAGDIITVLNEVDEGWWLGESQMKRGIFPVNYTVDYIPPTHRQSKQSLSRLSRPQSSHRTSHYEDIATEQPPLPKHIKESHSTPSKRPPPPPATLLSSLSSSTLPIRSDYRSIRPPPQPPQPMPAPYHI
ncbi:hypothetical protein BDB01DRAFT_832613 [Pilobolus umbonatus]|nr:hypothetical protein BDB01DRAFT_832613 [Pilobolus umbonatus]